MLGGAVALVYGAIAVLEFRQNLFVGALLRSFGRAAFWLYLKYWLENILLVNFAAFAALLLTALLHSAIFGGLGLPREALNSSGGNPFLSAEVAVRLSLDQRRRIAEFLAGGHRPAPASGRDFELKFISSGSLGRVGVIPAKCGAIAGGRRPEGTIDNSPAFQRRGFVFDIACVPEGREEGSCRDAFAAPYSNVPRVSALNRQAVSIVPRKKSDGSV